MRPTDDELYVTRYRDRFDDVPLPSTYISFDSIVEPRVPPAVYNGIYLSSYDYVRNPNALRERRIREYQTITGMDRMLGNLRTILDRLDLVDNTIIVFSTDHGIHHGEHGLGGKCFLYSESVRTRDWKYIRYFPRTEDPRQEGKKFRGTLDDYTTCLTPTLNDENQSMRSSSL